MSTATPQMTSVDEATAFDIAVEGYTFLYPLLLMETTRRQTINVERAGEVPLRAPVGAFAHAPVFPRADYRDVVRPNFDTLYSAAWLDLSEEPQILSVPAAGDNYYLLPMYDMWGEVFACPGTRTTGGEAHEFAIVGPGWSGELPAGVRRYDAPTSFVWIIGRTEASPATYEKVHAFQAGLTVRPLSASGTEPSAVTGRHDPSVDDKTPPLRQVFAMDAAQFFATAAELLQKYPPHFQDYPMLDRLARIGFRAGEPFDLSQADPVVQAAMAQAVPAAQKKVRDRQTALGAQVNGWRVMAASMGNYGTNYMARACVELIGLGANLPEDAIYPVAFLDAQGQPFTGARRYVWHLEKDELPPVRAFWSLTLYDDEGFQVANELDRFAIGDRDELQFGSDGSLDILIQHERPETGTSNWLPAPEGSFNLCARLYYPKAKALDGTWAPPAVRPV